MILKNIKRYIYFLITVYNLPHLVYSFIPAEFRSFSMTQNQFQIGTALCFAYKPIQEHIRAHLYTYTCTLACLYT